MNSDTWIPIDKYFWGGENIASNQNVFQKTLKNEVLEAGTYKLTVNFPDRHADLGNLGSNMANIYVGYDVTVTKKQNHVGGLRIKELNNGGYPIEYTYSNGILATAPSFVYGYTYPLTSGLSVKDMTRTHVTTHPVHPYSFSANGGLVGYRNISEKFTMGNLGRIDYEYDMYSDVSGIGGPSWLPGIFPTSRLENGFLRNKYMYDSQGIQVQRVTCDYTLINPKVYWGFKVNPGINYYSGSGSSNSHTVLSRHMKTYFYPIVQGKWVNKRIGEELNKDRTAPFSKGVTYEFNELGFIKTKSRGVSSGGTIVETYTYPSDHTGEGSVYTQMVTANILSPVIEVKRDHQGSITREKTPYRRLTNGTFVPSSIQQQIGAGGLETRISFENHDIYGNPVSINKDGLGNIIYLWSYKGEYPVAEIKYSDYNTVNTALATVGLGSIDTLAKNANPDKASLDKLRDVTSLKDAQITTYSYSPLKGIREETSPDKVTTYYSYDTFSRIKDIYYFEDNNSSKKRTVKAYEYNYKQ
ncbi:MAG: hypothetical protein LIO65_07180 [Odoribacter sp.]|nr:hypothetical protein [Odoribacter sp.]